MASGKFISYLRVSTDKQGRSGLGLEAQRAAVATYLNGGDWDLIKEFVEIESGRRDDRPALAKAMRLAKATGSTIVIAKWDRLSRDAHFLLGLQKTGVPFVATDNPHANKITIHILAAVAEDEAARISQRTKDALQAAKARGVKLGNPNGAAHLRQYGNAAAVAGAKERARAYAADLTDIVADIRDGGASSLRAIAEELTARGVVTRNGGAWHPASVRNLLARMAA